MDPLVLAILAILSLMTVTIGPLLKPSKPTEPTTIQRTISAPESVDSEMIQQP